MGTEKAFKVRPKGVRRVRYETTGVRIYWDSGEVTVLPIVEVRQAELMDGGLFGGENWDICGRSGQVEGSKHSSI